MLERFKNKFIGDSAFYKRIIFIAFPMILQNAITSFVSFLDNIMVGQIGTEQMSGVAIVNQLIFVFNICIFGGVSGASIFGTQFFGKGDYKGQKHCFRIKVYTCAIILAIALVLFNIFDESFISLFLHDSGDAGDIALALKYGKQYLAIMVIGLVPFSICQVYISSIRETGHTLVPMIAGAVAVGLNIILDLLLIFGFGPIPALGVQGAAIATVASRFVECIIVIIWTHTHKKLNPYIEGVYKSLRVPRTILKPVLITGFPLMINEMLWAGGMAVITQCYSVRGLNVVAALNISTTITNLFNIVYIQLGASISIIIGQHLGAGNLKEAKRDDNRMIFFSVLCCIVMAGFMIVLGRFFPSIYKTSDSIKELARNFIVIAALAMPLCSFSHCAYFTLRSGGKTIVTFLFDSVYTWVIVIPAAFILSNYTALPILTVFFIIQFMEIFKVLIGYFMLRSNVWLQNLTNQ